MASLAKSAPHAVQHIHFPNESPQYRRARNALLSKTSPPQRVAAQRRALPPGGEIPEDYVFEAACAGAKPKHVRLSDLFAPGKDTLAIYSFMFGPERERPCPGCTHFLDGLTPPTSPAITSLSPIAAAAHSFLRRGAWLALAATLVHGCNAYDRDYFGDSTGLVPVVRKQQDFKMARNGTCRS